MLLERSCGVTELAPEFFFFNCTSDDGCAEKAFKSFWKKSEYFEFHCELIVAYIFLFVILDLIRNLERSFVILLGTNIFVPYKDWSRKRVFEN